MDTTMRLLFILSFLFLTIGCQAQSVTTSNLTVGTIYFAPSLQNDITTNLNGLAADSGTQSYIPSVPNLGTNQLVWTWPVNLSCVGVGNEGYQHVLLAPNCILLNVHYGPTTNLLISFMDTNGIPYVAGITGLVYSSNDMVLGMMSSNMPATFVFPLVFPPGFTNNLSGHTPLGLPCVWAHKNANQLEAGVINFWQPGGTGEYLVSMEFNYSTNYPKGGIAPSAGDSGSPTFFIIHNNPVLLGAMTLTTAAFCCVSDGINWNVITNALGGTNTLRIINLAAYPNF